MIIKKAGGRIFGASLTAAEKKAMDIEIGRQLAEATRKHELEIDAIVLWELQEQLGYGPERLRRFYEAFSARLNDLLRRYEMGDLDQAWLCQYKLKERGVDLEKWEQERSKTKFGGVSGSDKL